MKNKIVTLLILTLCIISCEEKEVSTEIKEIYLEFARRENDSIIIENISILNSKGVDKNFNRKIQINNLLYLIELSKENIETSEYIIKLLNVNIEKRQKLLEIDKEFEKKYLAETEYDLSKIEKEKLNIEQIEKNIALRSQEIVLLNAEFEDKPYDQYQLIKYIFKGEIEGEKRTDTLAILLHQGFEPKFVKNDKFINYQMIKASL